MYVVGRAWALSSVSLCSSSIQEYWSSLGGGPFWTGFDNFLVLSKIYSRIDYRTALWESEWCPWISLVARLGTILCVRAFRGSSCDLSRLLGTSFRFPSVKAVIDGLTHRFLTPARGSLTYGSWYHLQDSSGFSYN